MPDVNDQHSSQAPGTEPPTVVDEGREVGGGGTDGASAGALGRVSLEEVENKLRSIADQCG